MENAIENKVAQSGLIQLDLETIRIPGERIFFDIRPLLFMDLVLKEKDFRAFLGDHAWNQYQGKHVAISCSSDAIIPTWAYMLVSTLHHCLWKFSRFRKRIICKILIGIKFR
jgi:hypothetical protein